MSHSAPTPQKALAQEARRGDGKSLLESTKSRLVNHAVVTSNANLEALTADVESLAETLEKLEGGTGFQLLLYLADRLITKSEELKDKAKEVRKTTQSNLAAAKATTVLQMKGARKRVRFALPDTNEDPTEDDPEDDGEKEIWAQSKYWPANNKGDASLRIGKVKLETWLQA